MYFDIIFFVYSNKTALIQYLNMLKSYQLLSYAFILILSFLIISKFNNLSSLIPFFNPYK